MTSRGELRYRLRCIEKLGHVFRGDESLLDTGCGNGGVARLLTERVRDVVAIDIERDPAWEDSAGLRFQVADAERLPFADASFDVVHSKDSLHHMDSPEQALVQYRRVLRSGGTALIVEANRFNPIFYPHMTLILGHEHFSRRRFHGLVGAVFPNARFTPSKPTTRRSSRTSSGCSTRRRRPSSGFARFGPFSPITSPSRAG